MIGIERIIENKDWVTFLLLAIVFSLTFINYVDRERLKQLFFLPFNNLYFSNYESTKENLIKGFNFSLFLISNLTLTLFLYFVVKFYFPEKFNSLAHPFFYILSLIIVYWTFKFLANRFVAWVFDLTSIQENAGYIKLVYFLSINFYLLGFVIFGNYYFKWDVNFIKFTLVLYLILLLLRYYHFIKSINKLSFINIFYFILYICTLEITPLLFFYKWGVTQ
jgi:hypothetical protein